MTHQLQTIGVDFHGVCLNLQTSHSPLIDYAREHLQRWAVPAHENPCITVQCLWSEGKWDRKNNPFELDGAQFDAVGKRMLRTSEELLWLNTLRQDGLQLRFRRHDGHQFFEVSYVYHPHNKQRLQSFERYEYRKYFSLMDYLVYFPIMWHLERERGWTMVHASALAFDSRSIVIAGLGGTGKTTTSVALLEKPGFTLISENIIFTDGEFIYPCYEPIRLHQDSLSLLGDAKSRLTPMAFPEGLKEKSHFHFNVIEEANRTTPVAIFLPQFSGKSYVRQLPPELAAEKIIAMNHLALELNDYRWYSSALDMQWPKPGLAMKRIETIQKFTEKPRCYELGINRDGELSETLEHILLSVT